MVGSELAGSVCAVTESLEECMALGHANTARKLVGSYETWDSLVDLDVGRATLYDLRGMARRWREASEEVVPLTSLLTGLSPTLR